MELEKSRNGVGTETKQRWNRDRTQAEHRRTESGQRRYGRLGRCSTVGWPCAVPAGHLFACTCGLVGSEAASCTWTSRPLGQPPLPPPPAPPHPPLTPRVISVPPPLVDYVRPSRAADWRLTDRLWFSVDPKRGLGGGARGGGPAVECLRVWEWAGGRLSK